MRANRFLTVVFALVALAFAGVAVAAPDLLNHAFHAVTSADASAFLAWGPAVLALQRKHTESVEAMRAMSDKVKAEDRDFTAEESAKFDEHKAAAASLKTRIEREQELELAEAGLGANPPAVRGQGDVTVPAKASIKVEDNVDKDPKRGFAHFGDYAAAIVGASAARRNGVAMDQRLVPLAAAPSTYAGEGSGADGGLLIPPGFSSEIFRLSLGEDALLPMTDQVNVEGNTMAFPRDETTPWGTNGIRAYWQGEATAGTFTKPILGANQLRLKKLMALVSVSDELLADSTALGSYLPSKVGDSIRWKTNEAIIFGTGAGVPIGALTGGAAVVVSKDSGQATGTLSVTNLANMVSRLPPGSYGRAVWMVNNDVLPALLTLTLGNYPVMVPISNQQAALTGAPTWMLMGRPVVFSQHCKSFSSQGDVCLMDLGYYQAITKAEGVATATSMHFFFDADAMAFRTTFRMDGAPKLTAAISPANGSNTLSPFLQLQAR